jgi:hypothetical protein
MGRLLDWLRGIPDVAPTIEQTLAEGFSGPKLDHPVLLNEGDILNLNFPDGGVVRLHGMGGGEIQVFVREGAGAK